MVQDGNAAAATTDSPLTLRVHGGPRDGQVIKLSASKCTIGSSHGCTLRLCGKDVRPVHCLIVRGKAQTVIRRWSADTLLNGESFDDKQLVLGDLLRCGPVEFEVVPESGQPCGRALAAASPVAAPGGNDLSGTQVLAEVPRILPPCGTQVLPSLDGSMTVQMTNVRPLLASAAPPSLASPPSLAAEDVHATVAIPPRADALANRERELARRETEIGERDLKTAALADELKNREQALVERESDLARQEANLQQREAAVALREQALDRPPLESNPESNPEPAAAKGPDAQEFASLEEARQKLSEEREELARARREFDAQHALRLAEHNRWQEDHRQWKAQRKAAEDQMEGLHAQVEHQLAEILARRKHLDQDRDAWKSESERNHRLLEERAAEVARKAEEVEQWRKDLDAERQKAAKLIEETSRYEQLCTELTATRDALAARDQELAAARQEIAALAASAERRGGAQSTPAVEAEYREKLAQLERQAAELLAIRTQFEQDRAQWNARIAGEDADAAQALRRTPESTESAGPVRTRASDAPSNLSTWALLKDRIDFTDDEPEDAPPARDLSDRAPHAEPVGEDAESIERYMASLMDRVGGRSTVAPEGTSARSADAKTAASPRDPSAAATGASPQTAEAERPRPVVRKAQKTVTPEEVAAMRELANLNARVALTKHGARQMVPNIFAKATMAALAWTLAVAGYLLNTKHDLMLFCGAAACALVGAMFFARTLTATSQLFASRRAIPADAEKHDGAN